MTETSDRKAASKVFSISGMLSDGLGKNRRLVYLFAILGIALAAATKGFDFFSSRPTNRVGFCAIQLPSSALVALAKEKGFFAAHGIEADLRIENLGKKCLKHLLDGHTDFAVAYITPAVRALETNKDLGILTELHSSNRATSILYRKDRGIKTPDDLAGKSVGLIQGTHGEFLLRLFIMANDIDETSVKRVMATPDTILSLVQEGNVDAVVTWAPTVAELLKSEPDRYGLMESAFYTEFSMIIARRERLKEFGSSILRALQNAQDFYLRHPGHAQQIAAAVLGLPNTNPELWDKYNIRLGLSSVFKSMIREEYLYAFGGKDASVDLADSHVGEYFEAELLTRISPEVIWYK